MTEETRLALEMLTQKKISAAMPVRAAEKLAPAQYIRSASHTCTQTLYMLAILSTSGLPPIHAHRHCTYLPYSVHQVCLPYMHTDTVHACHTQYIRSASHTCTQTLYMLAILSTSGLPPIHAHRHCTCLPYSVHQVCLPYMHTDTVHACHTQYIRSASHTCTQTLYMLAILSTSGLPPIHAHRHCTYLPYFFCCDGYLTLKLIT